MQKLLENRFEILKGFVGRKATGADIHYLHSLLVMGLFFIDLEFVDKFNKFEEDIRAYLTDKKKDKSRLEKYRDGEYLESARVYDRYEVDIDATAQVSDNVLVFGKIRNISQGGAFFQPEAAYVDGEYLDDIYFLDHIDDNSSFILDIDDGNNTKRYCDARWSGFSSAYNKHGVGVKFKKELKEIRI